MRDDVDGLAAMLAYNALFSLMPVLMALGLLVGAFVRSPALREDISQLVTDELPPALSEPVVDWIEGAYGSFETLGIITIVTLLYGGSRFYSALDRAFAVVYRSERRGYLQRKLFAGFIVPILLCVLIASTIIAATATGFLATSLGRYIDVDPNVQEFLSVYLVAFLLGFTMNLIAYAAIPLDGSGWRGSIPGAATAGLLFVFLAQLYPLYITLTGGFSLHGAAFGLILLFMFWLYLAAQIIIIGAEINAELSGARERNLSARSG